jgi:hypothetical protein
MDASTFDIFTGTPVWVWLILAVLLYRGVMATRPRRTSPYAPLVLPIILFVVSLGSKGSMAPTLENAVWILALVGGGIAGKALAGRVSINVEPGPPAVLLLPGSWNVFWFILAIFLTNYVFGVLDSIDPASSAFPGRGLLHALASGIFSGLFLGYGVSLFARAKRQLRICGP